MLSLSDASFSSSLGSQPPLSGYGGDGVGAGLAMGVVVVVVVEVVVVVCWKSCAASKLVVVHVEKVARCPFDAAVLVT